MPDPTIAPMLRPGMTIGIVSPSWFGGEAYIPRARRGIAQLEAMGFKVRVATHAFENHGAVSAPAADRVADLHDMFRDPDVDAILCTIGGTLANHLLPWIDWDLIRVNPKPFIGFSDITVLHLAISTVTGLRTYYGPSLLTDFAEFPAMPTFSEQSFRNSLMSGEPIGELAASGTWTDEFLDWETGEDLKRQRHHHASAGWTWIHGGNATGPLVGGCLESLQRLRGTRYWPKLDGTVLFIETSEECRGPDHADELLMDFDNMGLFDSIAALLVSRPYGFNGDQRARFLEVVAERVAGFDFPVVADMDFGHTSPMLTLPIGARCVVDASRESVAIPEPGTLDSAG